MAKFWKTLFLLFSVPIPLFIAAIFFVMVRLGDLVPFTAAARAQQNNPELLWKGYRDNEDANFKLARLDLVRPEVLVMGLSRLGQIRSQMFAPYSFYNMARLNYSMRTYADLIRRFPIGYHPRVLFFSLDFYPFSSHYTAEEIQTLPDFDPTRCKIWLNALQDGMAQLPKHPSLLVAQRRDPVYGRPILGLQAYLSSYGYRQDGSDHNPAHANAVAGDPRMGQDPAEAERLLYDGQEMGADEQARFEEFTALCRERGIAMVGIQMPMYRTMIHRLETDPRYTILADFRRHLADGWFAKQGVIAFDFLDMPGYSDDPGYFMDSVHPTEATVLAALLKAVTDPRVHALLPKLDIAAMERKVEEDRHATQHLFLYDTP